MYRNRWIDIETEQDNVGIHAGGAFSIQWERNRLFNYSVNGIGTIHYSFGNKILTPHIIHRNRF